MTQTTKYRIVYAHDGFFEAQVKKWWGWSRIGIGRVSQKRAMSDIKMHRDNPIYVTDKQIDAAQLEGI